MTADPARRTLVVANRTASTPALLAEVRRRAGDGARFALLVPPERGKEVHDWTPEEARRLVENACKADVEYLESGDDAGATIRRLVDERALRRHRRLDRARAPRSLAAPRPAAPHLASWRQGHRDPARARLVEADRGVPGRVGAARRRRPRRLLIDFAYTTGNVAT